MLQSRQRLVFPTLWDISKGRVAEALLNKLHDETIPIRLADINWRLTDEAYLRKRDELIAARSFDDDMFALARQFAEADRVVIAAPYWDLSFPAVLKQYIEAINVSGITFEYTEEGFPRGLCNYYQKPYHK